jgi:carbonic anhydrase
MRKFTILLTLSLVLSFTASAQISDDYAKNAKKLGVQTKESQSAITPQNALQNLKNGNARFASGKSVNQKKYRKQVSVTAKGQYPYAAILSCLDSRVAVEDIFDLNNGDSFNGRIAGNVMNPDMLGSFEFATKLAGAKVIMVLGHTKCGAVKGACDFAEMGNLTGLLDRIEPAVNIIGKDWVNGEKNSKNDKFVEAVGEKNVKLVMEGITKNSPILRELIDTGKVILVGGVYDLETGLVKYVE